MPLASFWKWKLLKLRNGLLIHPQSQSKRKSVWRLGTITLIARAARRSPADFQTHQVRRCLRRSDCRVYSRNWPITVKWAPFCNFRGHQRGTKSKYRECFLRLLPFYMGRTGRTLFGRFAAILENSGQLRKPRFELYCGIPDVCLVKWWLKKRGETQLIQ